jgi:short-subunit dehydrogenase involved in D-alanine esterification of teichoic acids
MPFPYKNVLITGATSGIGKALAERMIADGIFVIAVGRRQDRLDELVAKYGSDKVAAEAFDVSDLDAIGPWAKKITAAYPKLDSIILNAGLQRTLDFTKPDNVSLSAVTSEMTLNYLSPVHTVTHFLPHLTSLGPATPASIVLVSSGLAIIPLPRCANYCASKAAIHSLAWGLRAQLASPQSPETHHIKVVEIIPPAVQTELHTLQPDLVASGQHKFGLPLEPYADETWGALKGEEEKDEILAAVHEEMVGHVEDAKKEGFKKFLAMFSGATTKA